MLLEQLQLYLKKETLAQVFPCEFCEIFKKIFFYKTPPVAALKCFPETFSCDQNLSEHRFIKHRGITEPKYS